jgi:hypothetical protein
MVTSSSPQKKRKTRTIGIGNNVNNEAKKITVVSIPKCKVPYSGRQGGGLDPNQASEQEEQVQMLLQRAQ